MIPLHLIHEKICFYYEIEYLTPFLNNKRDTSIYFRQMFHYLARKLNGLKISYETIGKYYSDVTGNSWNHSTVMHSEKAINNRLSYDKMMQNEVKELIELFPKHKIETQGKAS